MWILTSQEVLALTVIALWVKAAVLSLSQVAIRVRSKRYARSEDARMMGYAPAAEDWRIERLSGAWRNEFEATPTFLALAFAYVLGGGTACQFGMICLCFVAARYAQGWAQFTLRQPHRTIAFLLGFAASIAMAVSVLWNILGPSQ
jgi:uncharacterized MAPEG superfamily protein